MLSNFGDYMQDQLDSVTAQIQSRVAQFLSLKEKLITLKRSTNPSISSQAADLYIMQVKLEGLLADNMDKLKKLQASGVSIAAIPDLVSIGTFANEMNNHIGNVNTLWDQSAGVPVRSAGPGLGTLMFLGVGGLVVLGGLGVWRLRR